MKIKSTIGVVLLLVVGVLIQPALASRYTYTQRLESRMRRLLAGSQRRRLASWADKYNKGDILVLKKSFQPRGLCNIKLPSRPKFIVGERFKVISKYTLAPKVNPKSNGQDKYGHLLNRSRQMRQMGDANVMLKIKSELSGIVVDIGKARLTGRSKVFVKPEEDKVPIIPIKPKGSTNGSMSKGFLQRNAPKSKELTDRMGIYKPGERFKMTIGDYKNHRFVVKDVIWHSDENEHARLREMARNRPTSFGYLNREDTRYRPQMHVQLWSEYALHNKRDGKTKIRQVQVPLDAMEKTGFQKNNDRLSM